MPAEPPDPTDAGSGLLAPGAWGLDLDAAIEHFREHGWARVGRVASDAALAGMRRRADELMLGQVVHEGLFFQLDAASGRYEDLPYGLGWQGPSLAYRKLEKLELDPLFWAWINNPVFERVVRRLIASDVVIYRATLFNKAAQGGSDLPYHQDGGLFWGLDRDPTVQLWTALDDAPVEAGCVEVLAGTHRAGLATPNGGVVPAAHVARAPGAPLPLPARAGDVLLIHNHVWHRSGSNRTDQPRRGFTVCYMDAATRCNRKRRAPRRFVRVFERPTGAPEGSAGA